MENPETPRHLPVIDLVKAVAANLIVWHHLAFYGPMADAVHPAAPDLLEWFSDQARVAVQSFLVVAGFLSARSLFSHLAATHLAGGPPKFAVLIGKRYLRLATPYGVALLVAIACAEFARSIAQHPDAAAAPTLVQLLAHLLFLQDILDLDSLSAGIWYVAIDFQLYLLIALLVWTAGRLAPRLGMQREHLAVAGCALLALASLFWFNLDPDLDAWAIYFFGAYGLGIVAQRAAAAGAIVAGALAILVLTVAALLVEWRSRILVAGLTALLLLGSHGWRRLPTWLNSRPTAIMAQVSYALFLIHDPVCLVVGTLVIRHLPPDPAGNAAAMAAAWLLSIAAALLLHRWFDGAGARPQFAAR